MQLPPPTSRSVSIMMEIPHKSQGLKNIFVFPDTEPGVEKLVVGYFDHCPLSA